MFGWELMWGRWDRLSTNENQLPIFKHLQEHNTPLHRFQMSAFEERKKDGHKFFLFSYAHKNSPGLILCFIPSLVTRITDPTPDD